MPGMTPSQCRAARALIEMTQQTLATRARVALRTVRDFESGVRTPRPATLAVLAAVLDDEGVEFIDPNGGGPGVRMRGPE